MKFSAAFALTSCACGAHGALASPHRADPESARELKSTKSKAGKSKKSAKGSGAPRRAYLEREFPCLGPLASAATVAAYTEKDDTHVFSTGTVYEAWNQAADSTATANVGGRLETRADQRISRAEATLLCVTKCEAVLEGCTLFGLKEILDADGEVKSYSCFFYGDDSVSATFPVANPVGDYGENGDETRSFSVFYRGEDLPLPEHYGCDVPLGPEAMLPLIACRVEKFAADFLGQVLSPGCGDLLESASDDFEAYMWPAVQCTFEAVGFDGDRLNACLTCLADAAVENGGRGCYSETFCGEDSFITRKCPAQETCTADGQVAGPPTSCCGDACPVDEACVSKIATSMLCQAGAVPRWDAAGTQGGCMHSDTPGHFTFLADSGNGDYQCLEEA